MSFGQLAERICELAGEAKPADTNGFGLHATGVKHRLARSVAYGCAKGTRGDHKGYSGRQNLRWLSHPSQFQSESTEATLLWRFPRILRRLARLCVPKDFRSLTGRFPLAARLIRKGNGAAFGGLMESSPACR